MVHAIGMLYIPLYGICLTTLVQLANIKGQNFCGHFINHLVLKSIRLYSIVSYICIASQLKVAMIIQYILSHMNMCIAIRGKVESFKGLADVHITLKLSTSMFSCGVCMCVLCQADKISLSSSYLSGNLAKMFGHNYNMINMQQQLESFVLSK